MIYFKQSTVLLYLNMWKIFMNGLFNRMLDHWHAYSVYISSGKLQEKFKCTLRIMIVNIMCIDHN